MNGTIPSPESLKALEAQLLEWLTAYHAGLSEHHLLKCLREESPLFTSFTTREPLSLFRGHYLLFHTLYRLRDRLILERCEQRLRIDPLCIILESVGIDTITKGEQLNMGEPDIGFWYADLDRLATVTAEDVVELLRQLGAVRRIGGSGRRAALAALELRDPVDDMTIKQQYRRLAMRHHPDRGGDGQRLSEINAAFTMLVKGRYPTALD